MALRRGSNATLTSFGSSLVLGALLSGAAGCDSLHKRPDGDTVPPAAQATAPPTEHSEDEHRSAEPRVTNPSQVALSAAARSRLTTLRISAHVGSVIARKDGEEWSIGGLAGCVIARERIETALDNLSTLTAESTDRRPASGQEFELQIVALMNQEPALHFDIAGRDGEADLVQLRDATAVRLLGLDRKLWSPHPRDWCAPR